MAESHVQLSRLNILRLLMMIWKPDCERFLLGQHPARNRLCQWSLTNSMSLVTLGLSQCCLQRSDALWDKATSVAGTSGKVRAEIIPYAQCDAAIARAQASLSELDASALAAGAGQLHLRHRN